MGDWVPDPARPGRWVYLPDTSQPTMILPVVPTLADVTATAPIRAVPVEPWARSAGEQDHSDPWVYAGAEMSPP